LDLVLERRETGEKAENTFCQGAFFAKSPASTMNSLEINSHCNFLDKYSRKCKNDNRYHIITLNLVTSKKPMKTSNHSQACILKVLEQTDKPLSAQGIWVEIQRQGQKIGIATVYRNLESLKIEGLIQIRTIHNQAIYSLVSEEQNFANCLKCGERIPLEISLSQSLEAPTLQAQTFEVYYHTFEVFGLCSPCQERSP